MNDTASFPVKAFNAPATATAFAPSTYAVGRHQNYHAPADVDPIDQPEEAIHCICGFNDDDGWTVACDECNRWQHQSCYYPQYDEREMPADMQHACVECKPRPVDWQRAQLRQREKRAQQEPQTNGVKRNAAKSHKKKVKEPYTNGWPVDKLRHDRNSASPRDQPPPAKRPKTSHRTSDSTTTTTKGHSRKRNASSATHRRSLSRSPDSPIEHYSEEFLRCYQEDDWVVTNTNLHNSIAVTNALSEWLGYSEEEFQEHHHQAKGEILNRWDGDLDDIPGKAQVDILETGDSTVQYNGEHPTWKMLTVREPIAEGAYIGELKGHVGFKKEYQSDNSNRWTQLRHPEPFVFFHPRLPIYIDARNEGTELRYVRRSCQPNARLQILVTDNVDYHFCFMATTQIDPGMEIAVAWDTQDGLPDLVSKTNLSAEEMDVFSAWVSTALANCGPCACGMPEHHCSFSRLDRRRRAVQETQQTKPKGKKRKAHQISPINTNALNSRSGSEARKIEPDDDGTESRSTSGSAGRGSASRDITPNTHYSTNGTASTLPELSERERKKLAKEEEIFRRQEEEKGKAAKKKRGSNGSNLNTPSATSSKQLGFPGSNNSKYVDAGTSKQSGLPQAKSMPGRKPKNSRGPGRPPSRVVKRAKPVYVVHEVQCDMDAEEARQRAPTPSSRRPFVTKRQRLLELCARNNSAIRARQSSPNLSDTMDTAEPKPAIVSPEPRLASNRATPEKTASSNDVDMVDIDEKPKADPEDDAGKQRASVDPPAPAENPQSASSEPAPSSESGKPNDMHLQMPPPPTNPFGPAYSSTPTTATNNVVQSPAVISQPSIFSPSVSAAVAPSPAKKKLSLSDYTRRKAKDKDSETSKTERESSPASTNSATIVPPLRPSSSADARAAEGGSAIDEDVKMEDAGDPPAIKA